jgi:large-conductance mechanosensitive channel
MKFNIKIGFSFLLIFWAAVTTYAQQIKATASLDSANILIGDQVKLFLEIDHPKDVAVQFPQVPDTIANKIEVLNRSGIDTFKVDDEKNLKQIQSYLITSFDSGVYRIPPYWFKINVDGHIDSIPSNGVTLQVHTMAIDTTKGPADIKMPYGAPLTLKEVIPYILGVILIGAIIFLILYSIKRKKKNQPLFAKPPKPKEPAHVIALRELDRIKSEKIWQKDKIKQYYSEVTEVLRIYIEDRFEISAMEKTTDEIIQSFKYRNDLISEKSFNNLNRILSLADLVKFAKYNPLPDDNNLTLVDTYFFVNDTKKEVVKKQEEQEKKNVENGDTEEVAIK